MPYKCYPHYRVRVEGFLGHVATGTGDHNQYYERFSIGVDIASFTDANGGQASEIMPALDVPSYAANCVVPWARGLLAHEYVAKNCKVDTIKINAIDQMGHYLYPVSNTFEGTDVPDDLRGAGATFVPFQNALVISTATDRTRGRGAKGRLYLPVPSVGVDEMGSVSTQDVDTIAGFAAQAYKHLEAGPHSPGNAQAGWMYPAVVPILAGRTVETLADTPAPRRITAVRVGHVVDTMRSRRRNLPESYDFHTLASTS